MIIFLGVWLAVSTTAGAILATLSRRDRPWIESALIISAWVMIFGTASAGTIYWGWRA